MRTKRAVIFDIGGVLLRLGSKEYNDELRQELGAEWFDRLYDEAIPGMERGELLETDVWQRISGRPVAEDAFDAAFARHFTPNEQMLAFARELREMGVMTAILSNTIPSHVRVMRTMGFMDQFNPVVLSCEIGSRKPEPEAIQRTIEAVDLPPQQIAYIDDVEANVEMGRSAGVLAILHEGDFAATRRTVLDWLGR